MKLADLRQSQVELLKAAGLDEADLLYLQAALVDSERAARAVADLAFKPEAELLDPRDKPEDYRVHMAEEILHYGSKLKRMLEEASPDSVHEESGEHVLRHALRRVRECRRYDLALVLAAETLASQAARRPGAPVFAAYPDLASKAAAFEKDIRDSIAEAEARAASM